jgi:membrane-associated phospholipid phosphatase
MIRIFLLINLFLFLFHTSYSQGFRELDTAISKESNLDLKLFRTINNGRWGFSNSVIPITDKSVLPVSIVLPIAIMSVSRIKDNYYDENSGVLLLLSELTSAGFTFGAKQIFKRERPFVTLDNVHHNKYNSPTDRYSFPSGHTATTFSMATSLILRYPDKPVIITVSYLYAAIIGYGRIFLGVHYPSDVLGGMLIGSGSAALIYSFRKEIIDFKNNLFKEKYRSDNNNNKEISTPVILGLTIGVDIINNFIQSTGFMKNVLFASGQNELTARINF